MIYSITIRGIKFYFEAQISDEQYKLIDRICDTIQEESQMYCAENVFPIFTNRILTEINIPVTPIRISHVFRIN